MPNQHVTKHSSGGWQVKGAGNSNATAVFDTQAKAIDKATQIATNQHAEVVIHGRNGRIREKNSYGNDPKKIKG